MKSFESLGSSPKEPEIPINRIAVWPFSVWEVARGHKYDVPEEYKILSPDDNVDEDIDIIFSN